ncbi:hypothetical protein V8D89_001071 [Ganoderma adspersum]
MSSTSDIAPSVDMLSTPCSAPLPEPTPAPHSGSPPTRTPSPLVRFVPEPASRPEPAAQEPEPMQVDVAPDARHDLIEQIFQRVEQETARRAQAEEERSRPSTASKPPSIPSTGSTPAPTVSLRDSSSVTVVRDRRRGSISVSRFGQPCRPRLHLRLLRIDPGEQQLGNSTHAAHSRAMPGAQQGRRCTGRDVTLPASPRNVVSDSMRGGNAPVWVSQRRVRSRGFHAAGHGAWRAQKPFSPGVLLGSLVPTVAASVLGHLHVLQRVARASALSPIGRPSTRREFVVGYGEETCFANLEASEFALPVF